MKPPPIKRIDLQADEVQAILDRARVSLEPEDYAKLEALIETVVYLMDAVENKNTTIGRLRKLLFGSSSEKMKDVLDKIEGVTDGAGEDEATAANGAAQAQKPETPKRKGHGRNGADAYTGAERIQVPHESLRPGDPCLNCRKGTVYNAKPKVLVRIVGQAPVQATVYEQQSLRCNLCGQVFTADLPEGVGTEKYDATSASMIALLKYGSGLPFNRLEGLQGNLGIPLPASTQWDIVNEAAEKFEPVYEELIRQAAQGEVLHNDDTTMKILDLMGKRAKAHAMAEAERAENAIGCATSAIECAKDTAEDEKDAPEHKETSPSKKERKGIFTSGIVSTGDGHTIALFFTGRRHAGENLAEVLQHRASELRVPIQMCDGLSRNLPEGFKTILSNCNAHGRRKFVDVVANFPEPCRYVLDVLGDIYTNDAIARERNLSPQQRLTFHQAESKPSMEKLKAWLEQQLEDRLVEPNSGLGQAISYMLNHWDQLTLFLREAGAPLDNNICERILKRAILHRKNAMFYKSKHGARVGDLFMSLIHTCQLGDVNPFDYLTELGNHADELPREPQRWMPWNYRSRRSTQGTAVAEEAGYVET